MGGNLRKFRRWQLWTLPVSASSYITATILLATGVLIVEAIAAPWNIPYIAIFLGLVGCGIISIESTRRVREVKGTVGRDLATVWYLAIAVTLPSAYAFMVPIPLAAYRLWRVPSSVIYRRVFSNATISLGYGAAALAFHAVLPAGAGNTPGGGWHVIGWTMMAACAGALAWLINSGILLGAMVLANREFRIRDHFGNRETIVLDFIELSLAVSLSLVVAINPVLMTLALPSIVLYRRYLMQAQVAAQAIIDAKTGVLNARAWRQEAEVEVFRAVRKSSSLALVFVDVDHFESVSQTAGAQAGDQVLRGIAATLTENLAERGLIGRFGSEEFAILLPHTSEEEARRVAEGIRDRITGEPIAIEDGSHAGFVFRLTVSIGIAVLGQSRRALAELVSAADEALSEARSTGQNRVCVIPPSGEGHRD